MGERQFILYLALISGLSALAIDMVLPAFAEMRPAFGLADDSPRLSLTISLFFVGSGIGQLVYGPVADAVGRKPVLLASLVLYGVSALVSTLAPTLTVLLVARFVWGLAAAGSRVLSQAILRDRYTGDAMARVMNLVQTAFFLGPIVAPVLGEALVQLGSWRWVMGFGVVTATVAALWSLRLPETLAPETRRPLQFSSTIAGFGVVIGNRVTLGYLLALTFGFGAFYSFLASSELVFADVFDRSSWFVPFFSISSVILAAVTLSMSWVLRWVSGRHAALGAGLALSTVSALFAAVAVATGGVPPFGLFLVLFVAANACHVAFFPTAISLALEPMGALAGTAAAVIGFTMAIGGAALGAIIDSSIDGTITPIAFGYAGYSLVALGFQALALTAGRAGPAVTEARTAGTGR